MWYSRQRWVLICTLLQAAPWGEWRWLLGLPGEESHSCGEWVPADVCVGCAGTAISCQSCAAHFPPLHRGWQCPAVLRTHRELFSAEGTGVSGQALGYLGRHWGIWAGTGHTQTQAVLEGQQTNEAWHCHCYAGKEELKPEPSAAMEKVPPSTSAGVIWEKAGCRLVVGGCGCRQLGGGCGVGGSWVVLEETWNVTNQCLFHSYLSHMHFKAFTIWDDAGRTNNECRQSLNWLYTQIHILFWKTTLPLTLIGNHRSPCNIDGPLWNWC